MATGCLQKRSGASEARERTALSNRRKPYKGSAAAVPTADDARHAAGIAMEEKTGLLFQENATEDLCCTQGYQPQITILISFQNQNLADFRYGGKGRRNWGHFQGQSFQEYLNGKPIDHFQENFLCMLQLGANYFGTSSIFLLI